MLNWPSHQPCPTSVGRRRRRRQRRLAASDGNPPPGRAVVDKQTNNNNNNKKKKNKSKKKDWNEIERDFNRPDRGSTGLSIRIRAGIIALSSTYLIHRAGTETTGQERNNNNDKKMIINWFGRLF